MVQQELVAVPADVVLVGVVVLQRVVCLPLFDEVVVPALVEQVVLLSSVLVVLQLLLPVDAVVVEHCLRQFVVENAERISYRH